MKFQRAPLILLTIALLLGAFVYLYEVQGKPQRETAKAQNEQLFAFKEEEVRSLALKTPIQTLAFAKTPAARLSATKPEQSAKPQSAPQQATPAERLVWAMTVPDRTVANDASVAYLLNLLATGKRQQTLTIPAAKQAEFGLEQPIAIVDVTLANQQTHRLVLGKPNFNRSALYAQVDPPASTKANLTQADSAKTDSTKTDMTVVLVSTDFENAVNRPLADWKAKEPSPQPSPTPKEKQPSLKKP